MPIGYTKFSSEFFEKWWLSSRIARTFKFKSLLVLASKCDSALTNKNEFLLVVYVSPTKKKVFRKVHSGEKWKFLVLIVIFSCFWLFSGRIFVITIRNIFLEETFLVETTKKTFLFLLTPISLWTNYFCRRSRLYNGSDFDL